MPVLEPTDPPKRDGCEKSRLHCRGVCVGAGGGFGSDILHAFGDEILLGHVALPDLGATLRSATALLQPGPPSRFNRLRLPAKLTLYLRSGVPTITFAGGVGELLVDREEVLMTYTDDPEELADRIVELVADADLRQRLARGGPLAAKRLFDAATNTDALLAYYRSALQSVAPALGSPDRST